MSYKSYTTYYSNPALMKKDLHPTYYKDATITCSCGNVIHAGSTVKELKTELCSACHPFYTGVQKLVDTAGRVDKFMAKRKKAVEVKEQKIAAKGAKAAEKTIGKTVKKTTAKKKTATKKKK